MIKDMAGRRSFARSILDEADKADAKYGDFTSTHEGYGVLAEEVAELLEAIRKNDYEDICIEAMQVSAVAYRIMCSLDNHDTRKRSGIVDD